ncbi:unnamed protein product [Sphagnum troendelagicum]|uniref:Uncharacterized protein n=1 Tax=Sphagnum troendelagicum TaxID=128251 RepID=A0ABP0TG59_9BRYO
MPDKSTDSESPCAREISKISKKTYFSGSGKSASSPIDKLCILSSSSDEEDTPVESPRGVRIFEKKDAGKSFSEKSVDAPGGTGSAIGKNRSRQSACRASGFGSEGSPETACRGSRRPQEDPRARINGVRCRSNSQRHTVEVRPCNFKKKLWGGTYIRMEMALRVKDALKFYTGCKKLRYYFPDSHAFFASRRPLSISFKDLDPLCKKKIRVGNKVVLVHTHFSKLVRERAAEFNVMKNSTPATISIPDSVAVDKMHQSRVPLRTPPHNGTKELPHRAPLDLGSSKPSLSSTDQVKPLSCQPEPLERGEDFQGEEHLELLVPHEVSMISPAEEAVSNYHLEAAHCGNFAAKQVFSEWNCDEQTAGFQIVTPDVEMPSNQQPSGITGTMDFTGAAHNTDPVRPNGLDEDSDKDPLQNKSDQSGLRSQFMELHRPSLLDVPNLAATGIEKRDPSLPASEEHGFWWCPVGHGALLTNRKESQLGTCMACNPSTVLQFP